MQRDLLHSILKHHPRALNPKQIGIHLIIDVLLWVAIGIASLGPGHPHLLMAVCAGLLFSIFSFRAFALMHDCVHSACHPNMAINTYIGETFGVFSFLPFKSWRQLHLDHHTWTGNVDRDPSMKILLRFKMGGFQVPGFVAFGWRRWVPILAFMQHLVFWQQTVSKKQYGFLIGSLTYLALVAVLMGPFALLVGLVTYLYLVEIINFPHHLGMRQFHGEERFPVWEQHRFTRSCLYSKWFAHLVLLNFNLHNEHHLFPSHPWYQLDDLHDELKISETEFNTSSGNQWILQNRKKPVQAVFAETFTETGPAARKNVA